MPTGTLPAEGKKIWERVYDAAKADGDSEEKAARKAWGAVKNAGWSKNAEGTWTKKAELEEFSLTIRRVSNGTDGLPRWRADTSDIDSDSYDDNMSLELFSDFLERIEREELPPEPIREHYVTDFWRGGTPYLSLSHYPDCDGDAVPGEVDAVYMDGKFLKAKGRLFDNKLGKAVHTALRADLEKRSDTGHTPVRISIAFLDYKHRHKDTGTVFERDFSDPAKIVCSECAENRRNGKVGGKVFLKGLLIHLAMTRVPVNKRTLMEVERSMTTRKEDAASIVGEELAEQIDEQALSIGKSEAEVIRADETPAADPIVIPGLMETLSSLTAGLAALTDEVRAMKDKKHMDEETPAEDAEEKPGDEEAEDEKKKPYKKSEVEAVDLAVALSEAMTTTNQKLDILIAAISQKAIPAGAAPERRSLAPNQVAQIQPGQQTGPQPGQPMKIADFVARSVRGQ